MSAGNYAAAVPPGVPLSKIPLMRPPEGQLPNFVDPESTAGPGIGVTVLFTVLMFLFVCVRLYTKFFVSRSKGWDDYTCIFACICSFAYMGLVINVFQRGYSVHSWNFPLSKVTKPLLEVLNTISAFYGPTMFFTKLTLFILYYRLFNPSKTMRYLIYFGIGFNFLFYTIYLFIYALMCPNTSKRAATCTGRVKDLGVATSAINVVSDFYILVIPLAAISGLQLKAKRKWGLMAIFFTGFLIISLHYRIVLSRSTDDVWNVSPVIIVGTVEFNIGIICSCLPTLPALFRRSDFLSRYRTSKPSYCPDSDDRFRPSGVGDGGRGDMAESYEGYGGGSGGNGSLSEGSSRDSVLGLEEARAESRMEMGALEAEEQRKSEWFRQARM
ncbi:MAG: hypothetical protein Q9174_000490 [Haloplaca sp. 1 TL-2023]